MGHYYREMYPERAKRQDDWIDRQLRLKEKLQHKKIGEFEVEDLPYLNELFDIKNKTVLRHFEDKYGDKE